MQPLPTTRTPTADYHSQLARSADRFLFLLAGVMGLASLGIAIAAGVWWPFLALTLPSLAVLGGVITLVPGSLLSRNTMALVLVALVAVMIQQTYGLVEIHFGLFVVLAVLLYYRDWRPVVLAAAAIAIHHGTFFWLQTQFTGIRTFANGSGAGIPLLHAVYVVVETGFISLMAVNMRRQIDILGADPSQLQRLAHDIAHDQPTPYTQDWAMRRDSLADSLMAMQRELQARRDNEQLLHQDNAQIRASLDASRTGMMIADADHVIRYANRSVMQMLERQIDQLHVAFPDLDLTHLVGSSIHRFHQNPDRIRGMLNRLENVHSGQIQIGAAHFGQVITPVFGDDGQRTGFVVEWHDRTDELALEGHIARIVSAASGGDFRQRLDVGTGKGFIPTLTAGINTLLGTMSGVTAEVRQMLSALSRGELDFRITGQYQGDLAAMKDDANATAEQLTAMLREIRASAAGIQLAASEIASGNSDLSVRTEVQAANLERTAASMEELTATVHHNAQTAHQANTLAHDATGVAEQGGAVVAQVVTTMQAIEQSSRRIADIIAVIDGIAFQTNILALNAAVEAARAGEQGRGFAVVAGEVRSLAQRSASAAREIKELITDSVDKVNHGARLVHRAGDTMQGVVTSVQEVGRMMTSISSASQAQSEGIEQVRSTVVQMDAGTQQNAALVEEASAAARALEDEAAHLMDAVSRFRYRETD